MSFEFLDADLQEKAQACKTPEELLKLAIDEGYELSDEEIEGVTGGFGVGRWGDHCEGFKRNRING